MKLVKKSRKGNKMVTILFAFFRFLQKMQFFLGSRL